MAQDAKERARDEQARGFYADRVDGGAGVFAGAGLSAEQ